MKNYKYLLLVSTCLLFNNNSLASELDLTFKTNQSPFSIHISDAHTPVELKPISNYNSTKLAAVCALAKGGCDGISFSSNNNDINFDNNIGIVFDVENRLAVALDYQIKKNVTLDWGDIPDEIPGVTYEDGKNNTKVILAFIQEYNENNPSEINYPGVEYAYNYSTKGTSKGEWFLPSSSEASLLLELNLAVLTGFKNAGKSVVTTDIFTSISSTIEKDKSIKMPMGTRLPVPNDGYPAFPVIRF